MSNRATAPQASASRLCAAAIEVDRNLARMDRKVDWLTRLTPTNVDEIWAGFQASGFREMPDSQFGEGLINDAPGLREELFALPVREIENPLIQALLLEKQREIDRQIELVRMRGLDGFIIASIDLFGHVSEQLLQTARDLLETVPILPPDPKDVGSDAICEAARQTVAGYRKRHPDFSCEVIVDPTPGTSLYMAMGNFHVAFDFRTAHSRVAPLIEHEIGTHAVTRYNGSRQPLHTLAGGLADYDVLQEGLAVLAEYLAGYLPASRLRTLAGRVVAVHMAVQESKGADIYACLVEECRLDSATAFDTAVRAKRGGGLTKDALYLKGLAELLAYLSHDGDLQILFLGKFALKQLHSLERLIQDGILHPPEIIPSYLQDHAAAERLARARTLSLEALYQESPET
ncbi:tyrosine/phenylalanine carboxypeptidase domain-containing protein [Altericroceibacterium xinjiangense]|uniref:tyrosine/phenylalanine carboxypeptidase domain-containing protein n=1 Tax=Altericroceibacterium xinjiangense TaxID=762261 RepID=UPI0013E043A5|nr:tyrosine/phenylalanine carboxypeptidase domain-containing protein [Altericroceibacterium xinjiangense]